MARMMKRPLAMLGVAVALLALTASSVFAQTSPQHQLFGFADSVTIDGETAGAGVEITASSGETTMTNEDGSWTLNVDGDQTVTLTVNGVAVEGEYETIVGGQTELTLTVVTGTEDDDSMMEDEEDSLMEDEDSMMEDDEDSMMEDDDDSMMEDDDDSMMDGDDDSMMDGDDDSMMDDDDEAHASTNESGLPVGGSGGLTEGGLGAGSLALIALLSALAVSVAGLGLRRAVSRS